MTTKRPQTYEQRLRKIVKAKTTTTEDDKIVLYILRELMGLKSATVVYGVVYPSGYGRAVSIQQASKDILSAFERSRKKIKKVS